LVPRCWQVYTLSHSAISLGLIGLATFIPIFVFALFGGLVADIYDRKMILIWSQVLLAMSASLLAFASLAHFISLPLIYAILGFNAIMTTFNAPARQSVVPNLVKEHHLMNALGLNVMSRQAATVVGPAIGGFMIQFWGTQSIYIFNAMSFILLIGMLIPVQIPAPEIKKKVAINFKSVWDGISFVIHQPMICSTMLLDAAATFFGSATTLLPIFAVDILKTGAQGLGLLYAAPSVGGVLAGLVVSSITKLKYEGRVVVLAVIFYALATIAFGLSKSFYVSLFFLACVGAGDMTSTIVRNIIRQIHTPDYMRGRMVSVNLIFLQGGPQLGEAEGGFLAALTSAPFSVVIGGLGAIAATGLIVWKFPVLWNYSRTEKVG
jgi:MFS family permease